tara:strand:+ start:1361 stop:1846 length:486 start_codon:yes stop_codon:yes gene_type:complete
MNKLITLFLLGCFSTVALAQVPVEVIPANEQAAWLQSDNPQNAADKKLVYDFWRKALVARDMDAARMMLAEDYIQHNPNVPTGRAPFIQFFGMAPQQEELPYIADLVSIIAENGYVTMGLKREMPNPNMPGQNYTTTWFDMFRVENGVIAEHWDYGTIQAR